MPYDNVMMKQIERTHAPDGREVDVKPFLHLVEDILKRATMQIDTSLTTSQAHAELKDKIQQINFVSKLDALSSTIHKISCEIAYNALSGTDASATTLSLFNMLRSYSWDAKLVLTLAAFALNYGDFWLGHFEAINNLIKVMIDMARFVVEFNKVPVLSTTMVYIPTAVYWTMRSVMVCAAQITGLTTMGHEFSESTTEAWELSTLADRLSNILEHLRKQLATQHIDEKRNVESFEIMIDVFEKIQFDNIELLEYKDDNMKILKSLIYVKDDIKPLIKSDFRSMLAMSDDSVMIKQIVGIHAPDGREVNVKPLLHLIEDILKRATLQIDSSLTDDAELEDRTHQVDFVSMLDALSYTIDRISCEIAYKALSGTDAHATTVSLFNMLSSYSWDAKLVLTMAAFAMNYGEFWLLAQIYSSNQLAKSMAILKQLPSIMENDSGSLNARFDALDNLIKVMMDVTRCVVEFKDLPTSYISQEVPALSTAMAHIPTAVYWTLRSVVACVAQITAITTMGHENILKHLRKQLVACYEYIDEKRNVETFQMLKNLFEMIHIDNMKVLKALIYANDDIQPLIDGSSKKRVHLEVLKRKNVLLLISGLDILNDDELSILEQIYNESRHYRARLDSHLYHPSLIEKPVIKFIKEVWHFRSRPILVVLDPQGKLVCPNALHMMWIWGSNAFPFTSLREESLWRDETWRLELLVDDIDPMILNWIKEGKYIFLYGGDDIEWVRKFTNNARAVAQAADIPLEMVYVGKSRNKREKILRLMATITVEKLSYIWQDLTMIWFFWTRLESMLYSKIQLGELDDHDPMMQEIKKLLSYDREGGWAVLSNGSNIVVNGHSSTILPALMEYDLWKDQVPVKGFDLALEEHHRTIHGISHPCCRFDFPMTMGRIPETMKCPECNRTMENFSTFLCCHDEVLPDVLF
ncbi:hypothetical protein OIU85_001892 [Salix viminalis]|uniref:Sieve element occlusion N-terminal domain-containing protein n=1 Tax=Salix viminalis TaxID=40686 RepID=A0A9Q0ZYJ9_SALVM|nr:hypothetical protein OIU85_001892 [Salix viminalis]